MTPESILQLLVNVSVLLGGLIAGVTIVITMRTQVAGFAQTAQELKVDLRAISQRVSTISDAMIEVARQDERILVLERKINGQLGRLGRNNDRIDKLFRTREDAAKDRQAATKKNRRS